MKKYLLLLPLLLFAFKAQCQETNKYPDYNDTIEELEDFYKCDIPINRHAILHNTNLPFYEERLKKDQFKVHFNRKDIPAFIRKKLFCLIDTIANPNEKWQQTDVVFEELPWRKLMFCATNHQKDLFIIVYRNGGIINFTTIMMMQLSDKHQTADKQKNIADIWIGQTDFQGRSIQALREYIRKHKNPNELNTNFINY